MPKVYFTLSIIAISILCFMQNKINAQGMKKTFEKEALEGINRSMQSAPSILTMEDISHLPVPVQHYLKYCGAVGKEKINNLALRFRMQLRSSPKNGWMKMKVQQLSFFDVPTRLFFLKASMMGIPARGFHCYKNGEASMLIKVLSLFPIIHEKGPEMRRSETVTMFNDMCLLAPATLIDPRISWEIMDSLTVRARFTVQDISISAILYFDEEGKLINFISTDRLMYAGKNRYESWPWETPVLGYTELNGRKYVSEGKAIWKQGETDFCYATFNLDEVNENINHY